MITAAILVGGHARRYGGHDKSALIVNGRSILEHQLAALDSVTDEVLLVGGGLRLADARARIIADRVPDSGPLGGLDAALSQARHEHILVLACDMPFLTTPFLAHLTSLAPGADAVVPRTERGYHPLCAVYARRCHPAVTRHLVERRLKMLDLLNAVHVRDVREDELARFGGARLLTNVNTPAEFDELETLHEHKS